MSLGVFGNLKELTQKEQTQAIRIAKLAQIAQTSAEMSFQFSTYQAQMDKAGNVIGSKPITEAMSVKSILGAEQIFTLLLQADCRSGQLANWLSNGGSS